MGVDPALGMMTHPAKCGGRAQGIEELLERDILLVGKIRATLALTEMKIMPGYRIAIRESASRLSSPSRNQLSPR